MTRKRCGCMTRGYKAAITLNPGEAALKLLASSGAGCGKRLTAGSTFALADLGSVTGRNGYNTYTKKDGTMNDIEYIKEQAAEPMQCHHCGVEDTPYVKPKHAKNGVIHIGFYCRHCGKWKTWARQTRPPGQATPDNGNGWW